MGFISQFFAPSTPVSKPSPATSDTGRFIGRSPTNPLAEEFQALPNGQRFAPNQYINVASSWIAALRWDEITRIVGNQVVTTHTGKVDIVTRAEGTLHYDGIPREVFLDWIRANSKGEFYGNYIKGKFTYLGKS